MYNYSRINSRLGDVYALTKSDVLYKLIIGSQNFKIFKEKNKELKLVSTNKFTPVINELTSYFNCKLKKFSSKLNISKGTDFQKSVWKELLNIPFGKVVTYKEIAKKIGKPYSYRAVGNAVGANPIPIIIPCHRVVSKGGIGGYSYGINYKLQLLKHEGIDYNNI